MKARVVNDRTATDKGDEAMKRRLLAGGMLLAAAGDAQAQSVHILMETVPDTEIEFAAADANTNAEEKQMAERATEAWRQRIITANKGSVEEARRQFREQGRSFEDVSREQYRVNLVRVYHARKILPRIQVTAEDMRRYYEKNRDTLFTERRQAPDVRPAHAHGRRAKRQCLEDVGPTADATIKEAQEEASRHNLTLAIINSHLNAGAAARRADARTLIERHVDGIIYATVFHHEVSVPRELRAVPAVLIGAVDRQGLVPAVLPDEAVDLFHFSAGQSSFEAAVEVAPA